MQQTNAEVIVCIDGDTILLPDAIENLVRQFVDPAVGAVAGSVYVGNQINLITRFQALEYTMSQSLDRRAFDNFNAIGVVPGAIGAWRRQAVIGFRWLLIRHFGGRCRPHGLASTPGLESHI